MKKEELPQERSALQGYTRELCYVKGEDGKFTTELSSGWEVKASALDNAWEDVHEQIEDAKNLVRKSIKSPLYLLMVKNLMDISILSGYTGFCGYRIKRHFKPTVYKKMSNKTLLKYAKAFNITLDELKSIKV